MCIATGHNIQGHGELACRESNVRHDDPNENFRRVENMVQLVNRIGRATLDDARLVVKVGPRYFLFPVSTIEAVITEGSSLAIISSEGTVRVRAILSRVEALLTETTVVRVHRSMLVNLTKIIEAETVNSGEYLVKLSSGRIVPASRKYRAVIDNLLGGFSEDCKVIAAASAAARV